MPLYREWSSDPYSLAAIWKIEEPEDFFVSRTGMAPDIKNEKRRMERLAGRFLLKHLEEDFPILNIQPDEHDKPRIADNQFYFSISHSWPYVAAVVSPYVEAGMDIQCWHPNMDRLKHKFLSPEEQTVFDKSPELITLAWSAKEAAYKWQGRRGVEFIDHLPITSMTQTDDQFDISINLQLTSPHRLISLEGRIESEFSLAVVINNAISHPIFIQ